jgi:hypothetical protein
MKYKVIDGKVICQCFFCKKGTEHPNRKYHDVYKRMSDVLLVAESLDPKDFIPIEFCVTCTHIRVIK